MMQGTITKPDGRKAAKPTAAKLVKFKPSPEKPYANWTELRLSEPVAIEKGVEAIMKICGGESYGAYAYRETNSGIVPIFSIYKTIERSYVNIRNKDIPFSTESTLYNIDQHVVCIEPRDDKTDRFWVSPTANLTPEKMAAIKAELGVE